MIGDSLLAPGLVDANHATCSAVTNALAAKRGVQVENRARSGVLLRQVADQYKQGEAWTHVLISGGVNDVPSNATASSQHVNQIISVEYHTARGAQYGGSLPQLVQRILSDGVLQVLLLGYPEGDGLSEGRPRHKPMKDMRDRLQLFARDLAPRVAFVDGAALFGPYPRDAANFAADKSHPSAAGGALLGQAIGVALALNETHRAPRRGRRHAQQSPV